MSSSERERPAVGVDDGIKALVARLDHHFGAHLCRARQLNTSRRFGKVDDVVGGNGIDGRRGGRRGVDREGHEARRDINRLDVVTNDHSQRLSALCGGVFKGEIDITAGQIGGG